MGVDVCHGILHCWYLVGSRFIMVTTLVTSLGVESETLVQSSLLPAANGSACSLALLSVLIEATNRRQFQCYFFSLPCSSLTTYVGLSPLHQ